MKQGKAQNITRWVSPLILAIVCQQAVRILTDFTVNNSFWVHPTQHIMELLLTLPANYGTDALIRWLLRKKGIRKEGVWKEYLMWGCFFFLTVNGYCFLVHLLLGIPDFFRDYLYLTVTSVPIILFYYTLLREQYDRTVIQQNQLELEKKKASLDLFTDIAHEFCTPLTLISGPCELIRAQKGADKTITEYADIIHLNAERMNSLISELMEFKNADTSAGATSNKAVQTKKELAYRIGIDGSKIKIERLYPKDNVPRESFPFVENRPMVAVVEDDLEMLWLIGSILCSEYNILPIHTPATVMDILTQNRADIIICDMTMESEDGLEVASRLRSDKLTSHIPLIFISADYDSKAQSEAMKAGAIQYITKPFDVDYLKSSVKSLLLRVADLKDYFESPLSAYELNQGKLHHTENRKFLNRVHAVINKNIRNEHLSADTIAAELGMTRRTFYRRLSESTETPLTEIIIEGRLKVVEILLLKSKSTTEEICFKAGFSSRASFYKAFRAKHGCNPSTWYLRK